MNVVDKYLNIRELQVPKTDICLNKAKKMMF